MLGTETKIQAKRVPAPDLDPSWRSKAIVLDIMTGEKDASHRIIIDAMGPITLLDHKGEFHRQMNYLQCGGDVCPCFRFVQWWRDPDSFHGKVDYSDLTVLRRDLKLAAKSYRMWQRYILVDHPRGDFTVSEEETSFKEFLKKCGDRPVTRVAKEVANYLLTWGFDVEVENTVQSDKTSQSIRIVQVADQTVNHVVSRNEAMARGEIEYHGPDNQIWFKGLESLVPAEAIAARIGHYVLNKIANDRVQARLQAEDEKLHREFMDDSRDLIVSVNENRLVLRIASGKGAPSMEASRIIARKVRALVKHFNRRKDGTENQQPRG